MTVTALPDLSRRSVLRILAGAPLIPLAGSPMLALLDATTARAAGGAPRSAEFVGMAAPATPAAQATTAVESSLVVTYGDGARQTFKLGYQPLFFTGDQVPDGEGGTTLAGGYYDIVLDFGGSISGGHGSLSTLWLWLDTPEGQYRYAAGGTLEAVTQAEDGSTTYVFTGGFSLSDVPETLVTQAPHDGTVSVSLSFWADGTLFATAVSMNGS